MIEFRFDYLVTLADSCLQTWAIEQDDAALGGNESTRRPATSSGLGDAFAAYAQHAGDQSCSVDDKRSRLSNSHRHNC
jgi:hypothetical protein